MVLFVRDKSMNKIALKEKSIVSPLRKYNALKYFKFAYYLFSRTVVDSPIQPPTEYD